MSVRTMWEWVRRASAGYVALQRRHRPDFSCGVYVGMGTMAGMVAWIMGTIPLASAVATVLTVVVIVIVANTLIRGALEGLGRRAEPDEQT